MSGRGTRSVLDNSLLMRKMFGILAAVGCLTLFVPMRGVEAAGGGSERCGYVASTEPCEGPDNNERKTCDAKMGGTFSCTLVGCDGQRIELGGPLTGCTQGGGGQGGL